MLHWNNVPVRAKESWNCAVYAQSNLRGTLRLVRQVGHSLLGGGSKPKSWVELRNNHNVYIESSGQMGLTYLQESSPLCTMVGWVGLLTIKVNLSLDRPSDMSVPVSRTLYSVRQVRHSIREGSDRLSDPIPRAFTWVGWVGQARNSLREEKLSSKRTHMSAWELSPLSSWLDGSGTNHESRT